MKKFKDFHLIKIARQTRFKSIKGSKSFLLLKEVKQMSSTKWLKMSKSLYSTAFKRLIKS